MNTGDIGDGSCFGPLSCTYNRRPIFDYSCIGSSSCENNTGVIQGNSW
jgi:hypothetical protein